MGSGGMKYIPSFLKIKTCVEEILKFTSPIWNAVKLVLLVEAIYEVSSSIFLNHNNLCA
jgi:hypothetical protein